MTVPKPGTTPHGPPRGPATYPTARPRVAFAGLVSARPTAAGAVPRPVTVATGPVFSTPSSAAAASAERLAPPPRERPKQDDGADPLDPAARLSAQLAPPCAPRAEPSAVPHPVAEARAMLEELLPAVVRRIAWVGDARRGSVRMELGAGELAGARIFVHAEDGVVRVEMQVPPGADAAAWRARIEGRLRARGIRAESVEVS